MGGFRATGGVATAAAGSGIGQLTGRIEHDTRPGCWGQAMADFVRKISHSTGACRSVGAERNRGSLLRSSSSHPLCPCGRRRHCSRGVPLVSGTSVPPLWRSPVSVSRGLLRIVASRWVSCGLPDPVPLRALPSLSRGLADRRHWRQFPVV